MSCVVVAKTVDNGPPGPEGTSDGVFVGIEVCGYQIISWFLGFFNQFDKHLIETV